MKLTFLTRNSEILSTNAVMFKAVCSILLLFSKKKKKLCAHLLKLQLWCTLIIGFILTGFYLCIYLFACVFIYLFIFISRSRPRSVFSTDITKCPRFLHVFTLMSIKPTPLLRLILMCHLCIAFQSQWDSSTTLLADSAFILHFIRS